jgi:hypothetical protein
MDSCVLYLALVRYFDTLVRLDFTLVRVLVYGTTLPSSTS